MKNFTVIILFFFVYPDHLGAMLINRLKKNSIKTILPEDFKHPIPDVSGYGYALDE